MKKIIDGMAWAIWEHLTPGRQRKNRPSLAFLAGAHQAASELDRLYEELNGTSVRNLFIATGRAPNQPQYERFGEDLARAALGEESATNSSIKIPQFSVKLVNNGLDLEWDGIAEVRPRAPAEVPHKKTIAEVREILAMSKYPRCSDTCPGWIVSESDNYGIQVETCDECMSALPKAIRLTDAEVAQLPEAKAELAKTIKVRDELGAADYEGNPDRCRSCHRPNPPDHQFTVLVRNTALGNSKYVGEFATQSDADAYIKAQVHRTRKFVNYEVWTGTPRKPGRAVGQVVHGSA